MFTTETEDGRLFAIKPMNCPGHVQIFKQGITSYRDLPLRMAEFGKCHRYEPSGALHGMMRVRAFTQDDAHIFCTAEQITDESIAVCDLILGIYRDFGFDDVRIKFSDRPEKRVGDDEVWDKAEAALQGAATSPAWSTRSIPAKAPSTGRSSSSCCAMRSAATGSAARCRSISTCRSGSAPATSARTATSTRPVMLHRAIFGSLERFIGILIEHYAGHLPLWLAPVQVMVLTITSDADDYAQEVAATPAPPGSAPRPICATRRSPTRCASTASPKCRCCWWWATRSRRAHRRHSPPRLQAAADAAAR